MKIMKEISRFILGMFIIFGLSACEKSNSATTTGEKLDHATDKADKAIGDASKKTSEVLDDASITAKVKEAIFAEPNLKSLQINVETREGIVKLSGGVDSKEQLGRVKQITSSLSGVKDVKNSLTVK